MKNSTLITYRDHLDFITKQPENSGWNYDHYIRESVTHDFFQKLSSTLVFLLDFKTQSYPVMGVNALQIMGHAREAFNEGGLEFMLAHYKDFELLNKKIFPEESEIIKKNLPEDLSNLRFSRSYRFRNHKGTYNTILQRNSLITNGQHPTPVAIFGCATDITSFAEKGKVIHQIEKYNSVAGNWDILLSKEYFPDLEENQLLSTREIEILKWSVEGLSSKQIAEKLFISFNTVNTHRRNMLRKTNCQNSLELLKYALVNRML